MYARKLSFLRFAQVQIGKKLPDTERHVAHKRLLDLTEPAHEPGRQPAGNAIGQQKIEILLLSQSRDQRSNVMIR
jgi:hypothetical protein